MPEVASATVAVAGKMEHKYDDAEALVRRTRAMLERQLGPKHPTVLRATMHHGVALQTQGAHDHAAEMLRTVLSAQTDVHGAEHPDVLETSWRLGALLLSQGSPESIEEAEALLRTTAARQTTAIGAEHPGTLRTLVSLGEALVAMGGHEREAGGLFEKCEAAQRTVLDPSHPDLAKTRALQAAHASRRVEQGSGAEATNAA